MLRRLFLRRVIEGCIGLTGVAIGLRWTEIGFVDNEGVAAAARTFNQAIVDHRAGRKNLETARSLADRSEWWKAEERYTDAHNQYYQAESKYENAAEEARRSNCDSFATTAGRYATYCQRMENACSEWAAAAELEAKGKTEKASKRREAGDELRSKALAVVDDRIPEERDPSSIDC